MKINFLNIKGYFLKHKIIGSVILIVLVIIGYQMYKSFTSTAGQISYVTSPVKRGNLITTVSGTGQVSVLNQVDIKTKASGDITYLNAKVGQEVGAGTFLAQIASGDAPYELESAKIAYDKLITVDPDALRRAENAVIQADKDLKNSYINAHTAMTSALTNMSDVSAGLGILFDYNTGYLTSGNYNLGSTAKEYQKKAESSWNDSDQQLRDLIKKYRNISPAVNDTGFELIIDDFNKVALSLSLSAKDTQDAIIYLKNDDDSRQTEANSAYTSIISLFSKASGIVSSLSASKNSVSSNKISLENAVTDLETLKDGPDTLTLRSQQLSVKQKQEALNDYSVTAPFSGIIAAVSIKVGDTVSSGATVATLITKQKMVEISLNEIDAAKVKVGQKVNLTFDAIDGLNITGTVSEVNLIGTVSQGVVSYTIKINFDTQDDRVKSGMSVSASIITEAKVDVLTIANSAVKTQGDSNYVEILDPSGAEDTQGIVSTVLPRQQIVTIGISNDTETEIISGLTEGQTIITKTSISGTTQTTTAKATSFGSILSGNRAGR